MKPSQTDYMQYDANTFDNEGFKVMAGRIHALAQKPRFWSVSVRVVTESRDGKQRVKDFFKFSTKERCMLSDLRDQIKKEVLDKEDYLEVCTECLVTARPMM